MMRPRRGPRLRRSALKFRFQPRLLGFPLLDVSFLDVAEAADRLGHAREPRQQRDLRRVHARDPLIDHRKIVLDQLALGLALFGPAERIERAAAQELELCENAERMDHPTAELLLLEMPGRLVALREDRRRQMELQRKIAVELLRHLLGEGPVG
ncbi:MAG: hypothetical protein JWP25_4999 [Bradyrhizobium sp.]|nr:hypothetical protein [Bradyrhizobium sp.]